MNQFVIADPDKCIGCRTCEVACVQAHRLGQSVASLTEKFFSPRLTVIQTAKISVPIQCRHCEDAPCAKVCPVKAIVQRDRSVQVISNKCIGCKSCIMACPYGAIELGAAEADVDGGNKVDAIKCDLCRDTIDGPACIKVCPTKALRKIDELKLREGMRNNRNRAAGGAMNF
ncbi:MAG: 4Fe-4S ferredoxin, iron-sulpur binding protein [Firmicutes bacterium]|nr:4Fe-4S ferredoxin, iron-sulpur binding protein [Bacillota bacterium]